MSARCVLYLLYSDVDDEHTFCFVFYCYVSDKHKLYLYFIVTSVMSARCVLYLLYSDVDDEHTFCFVFYCYVSDKHKLYLYSIVTLSPCAPSVLYLIVPLVISVDYMCTS